MAHSGIAYTSQPVVISAQLLYSAYEIECSEVYTVLCDCSYMLSALCRLAMIGFTAILVTEALSGKTVPEFWNLPHGTINAQIVNNAVVGVNTMNTFLTSMAPWN